MRQERLAFLTGKKNPVGILKPQEEDLYCWRFAYFRFSCEDRREMRECVSKCAVLV